MMHFQSWIIHKYDGQYSVRELYGWFLLPHNWNVLPYNLSCGYVFEIKHILHLSFFTFFFLFLNRLLLPNRQHLSHTVCGWYVFECHRGLRKQLQQLPRGLFLSGWAKSNSLPTRLLLHSGSFCSDCLPSGKICQSNCTNCTNRLSRHPCRHVQHKWFSVAVALLSRVYLPIAFNDRRNAVLGGYI
jgi:hypothetical protein